MNAAQLIPAPSESPMRSLASKDKIQRGPMCRSTSGVDHRRARPALLVRCCLLLVGIAALMCAGTPARAQIIQTIAGGVNPSNAPSENACPSFQSVATHGSDVYVSSCNQIFKVNAQGQWSHVAGSGIVGFSIDGTPAATASFQGIASLSLDAAGNIYFNDTFSLRVREIVASTGLIKTVAGTGVSGYNGDGILATSAQITGGFGMGVFADAHGNVFIADFGNSRVREVDAVTGIITTVAGNGTRGFSGDGGLATSAQLKNPRSVFVDGAGNIFIADDENLRIREVAAGTHIITTVAGNGIAGFAGDGGLATSAEIQFGVLSVAVDASGNLFIADTTNNRIRKVDALTKKIQTIAGNGGLLQSGCNGGVNACIGVGGPATNALVSNPLQVAIDASGNLYIPVQTTTRNMIEEVVASTGNLDVFAANGAQDFTGTNGPAIQAQLNVPNFAMTDGAGNVFIADANNNVIYEIVAATGILKIVAGTGVAGYSGDHGPATSAELAAPFSVVLDASGNLFIADFGNSVIRKVDTTGMITTVAGNASAACNLALGDGGPATSASLCFPNFAAVDTHGNIFIADSGYSLIREVDASTSNIQTVAGSGGGNGFGYSGDGGPATSALLNSPIGVFVDNSGNVFIADQFNNVIREVNTAGIITTVAGDTSGTPGFSGDGGPAVGAKMFLPATVWGDNSGNFYVADFSNNVIRKFALGGNIQTIAGNRVTGFSGDGGPATSAKMDGPDGAFVEPNGSVLIADINNGRVRIVGSPTTTTLATSANPSVVDQDVSIKVTVSVAGEIPPVGSVTILDNGTPLTTLAVSNGAPSIFVTSALALGYHLLTAQFSGTNYPGSVSPQLNQQVVDVGPNPSQGTPPSGPGALTAGAGSNNFGWPPGCDPNATSGPNVCSHTYGINYPPGMFKPGATVTVAPKQTTQAGWATRTPPGNPYFGTTLAPVAGLNGDGFIYSATCSPVADCPAANSTAIYSITTTWESTDNIYCSEGPQLLKTDPIGSNNWIGTLVSCTDGHPINKGRSGGSLSDWANVQGVAGAAPPVTITSPVNGGVYALNETVPAVYDCGPTGPPPLIATFCFGGPDVINGSTFVPSGSPVDTSSTGTKTFQVAADVNSGPGVVPPKTITYNVVAGNQASASPASVNFGNVRVGGFDFEFLELTNKGTSALAISNVRVTSVTGEDSDDFREVSLCPRSLGAGKTCFILVTFFADKDLENSPQSAILTIADNGVGGSLTVPLSASSVKTNKHDDDH